jgi:hypothetical protein
LVDSSGALQECIAELPGALYGALGGVDDSVGEGHFGWRRPSGSVDDRENFFEIGGLAELGKGSLKLTQTPVQIFDVLSGHDLLLGT